MFQRLLLCRKMQVRKTHGVYHRTRLLPSLEKLAFLYSETCDRLRNPIHSGGG